MNPAKEILDNSAVTLPPNTALPPLPVWKAPSFWAQMLMVLTVLLNTMGIDLMAVFQGMGLGASPEEVVARGQHAVSVVQQLLPMVFGIWAYVERKAPHFRLTFWKTKDPSS